MSRFLNALRDETNVVYTANGGRSYKTTNSAVLDLFSQIGAMRNSNERDKISLFSKAFSEDKLLTMKVLFYARDIREGQGERQTFRDIIKYLADYKPDVIEKNILLIPEFGRWDDLYALDGTRLENSAYSVVYWQFKQDIVSPNPSQLAKWLPSENASSPETKRLARKTMKYFGLSPRLYRKSLSALRKKIDLVETKMSENRWEDIDYSKIPSQAGLKYRQAFFRNDGERYEEFIESLRTGKDKDGNEVEVKINAKTLHPHQIVGKFLSPLMEYSEGKYYSGVSEINREEASALDVMWRNLPNYLEGVSEDSICVVDTSGSMRGLPIQVAISLGIYIAERNSGAFKDHFITFSDMPSLEKIQGETIGEKVVNLSRANWEMNTNLERTLELILNTAVKNNIPQEEMVKRLFIISDMQFDSCTTGGNDISLFENMEKRFRVAGYEMPSITFWCVNSSSQFPMTMNKTGVQLVSGFSPTILTALLSNKLLTAYELMLEKINSERYSSITI